jgi:hypothetical protein
LLGCKKYFYELSIGNNPPASEQNEKGEILREIGKRHKIDLNNHHLI